MSNQGPAQGYAPYVPPTAGGDVRAQVAPQAERSQGLTPGMAAEIAAIVRQAIAAERQAANLGMASALPRMGAPARMVLDAEAVDLPRHPLNSRIVKSGAVWVDPQDGELYNDHGQRVGRRVDVYHRDETEQAVPATT